MFNGIMLADAIAHVISVILISGAIVLVGAIVLHPTGTKITAPAQLGDLLVPFLGNAAPVVMGIALLAAGFSSFPQPHNRTAPNTTAINAFFIFFLYPFPRVFCHFPRFCYLQAIANQRHDISLLRSPVFLSFLLSYFL